MIINIIRNNKSVTQDEIAKEFNKSLRTVKAHMLQRKENELIER